MKALFLTNIVCSLFLTGLIWVVQLVHYPSFQFWGSRMAEAHAFHSLRISVIVVPVMMLELASSFALSMSAIPYKGWHQLGLVMVLLIWAITFFYIVPVHNVIPYVDAPGLSIQKLVSLNVWRTVFWSLKSLVGIYLLWQYLSSVESIK
jgi:hypothetical protein